MLPILLASLLYGFAVIFGWIGLIISSCSEEVQFNRPAGKLPWNDSLIRKCNGIRDHAEGRGFDISLFLQSFQLFSGAGYDYTNNCDIIRFQNIIIPGQALMNLICFPGEVFAVLPQLFDTINEGVYTAVGANCSP